MPGLFGFVKNIGEQLSLSKMKKSININSHYCEDDLFEDEKVASSRVHLGIVGSKNSPVKKEPVFVWVEGEVFNLDFLCGKFQFNNKSFESVLIEAYLNGQLKAFLNQLDGDFCAVLYDSEKDTIKLITDRFGLRLLYFYKKGNSFIWSSEVKGILAHSTIDKTIDREAFKYFYEVGSMVGGKTWFKYIKLIDPATILNFDLNSKTVSSSRYWNWSEIEKNDIEFDQAVKLFKDKLLKSINKRYDVDQGIGLSLSGGLDSRAIFAAIQEEYPNSKGFAYTFGIDNCSDFLLAEKVINKSKWDHKKYFFTSENWFSPRIDMVWRTDGLKDLKHFHGAEFLNSIRENLLINLNGYGGGLMTGQLLPNKGNGNKDVDVLTNKYGEIFSEYYKSNSEHLNGIESFIYENRYRRFSNIGMVNTLSHIEQRKPLLDNGIIEHLFSLPDEYRRNNLLYSSMLTTYFPNYFKNIPWQKTGVPVGVDVRKNFIYRIKRKLGHLFNDPLFVNKNYTNYSEWIKSGNVIELIENLLNRDSSFYKNIVDNDFYNELLEPHLNNSKIDNSDSILRVVTFEIYMYQVFEKKLPI